MNSLIQQTLTIDEKRELYQIGRQYYHDRGIGPDFQEWMALTEIPYHQNSGKVFQLMQDNGILGYTVSAVTQVEKNPWRKVIEGGISSSSKKKIRDFVAMFDYLKQEGENLIIEVGEKEEKMYHVLTKYCGFQPFSIHDLNEATQVMKVLLNNAPFKLSQNEDDFLRIKRETRQIKDYQGRIIFWKP
ncbi:MAG: hypothetical protein NTX24_02285 [Candidatus Pacearchaeota archaeon]|nr:hypothetical protein [Candidatus Pacearchaeota archaeon]